MDSSVNFNLIRIPMYRRILGAGMVFGGFCAGVLQAVDIAMSLGIVPGYSPVGSVASAIALIACSVYAMPTIGYLCLFQKFPQWVIAGSKRENLVKFVKMVT